MKTIDLWEVRLKVLNARERGEDPYALLTEKEALVYQYAEHGFGCPMCAPASPPTKRSRAV